MTLLKEPPGSLPIVQALPWSRVRSSLQQWGVEGRPRERATPPSGARIGLRGARQPAVAL